MRQQRILLYVLPLIFGVGGIFFPIGVLVYWTVSNLWTLGQQSLVSRRP
jgi:YidC/Oxa1 family membrane protein insertase